MIQISYKSIWKPATQKWTTLTVTPPFLMAVDILIEQTESHSILGVYFDQGLTWDDKLIICKRVTSGIYALRNLVSYHSFVQSIP